MGIVEDELAAFRLSTGERYRIERNVGGTFHLHMGDVRLTMSPEEFETFATTVSEANTTLARKKGW